ncbi:TetR family transcriptional regulator [Actinocorallia herbida]|uniref:TetR family transcriptional regulator n=1 Tax=Actinocorallia herbida TaxID=58109 RepID=A0A3N1CW15_9ACTN|nr:helix-turn-helix domain-containing protein [Actinocorallia herbida]ROO84908.1 TetR family transcriptional regulator [Actinocorallia herbida]
MTTRPAAGGRKAEAARNNRTVLNAAREVFFEQGFDAPMSAIAERAGVGMGSLYRRYPSKEVLARHLCTISMEGTLAAAERALAEESSGWSALVRFITESLECGMGALSGFAGSFPVTQAMIDLSEQGANAMQEILTRAAAEGSVRPDLTPGDLVYLLKLLATKTTPDPARTTELRPRYLTIVLDGLRPTPTPLPAPAPTWPEIAARWGPATDLPEDL